jgi:hypothetical protein
MAYKKFLDILDVKMGIWGIDSGRVKFSNKGIEVAFMEGRWLKGLSKLYHWVLP